MALVFCTKCGHKVSTTAPRCPGCGNARLPGGSDRITAGTRESRPVLVDNQADDKKRCFYCAEWIPAPARKCRYCGSDLTSVSSTKRPTKPHVDYGLYLLLVPICSTVLIWLWIGNMNLLQPPGTTLSFIVAATILSTALMAAIEADKLGLKYNRATGTDSPLTLFISLVGAWLITYPAYLHRRSRYGFPSRAIPGTLFALLFAGSVCFFTWAIAERQVEAQDQLRDALKALGGG